MHSYAPVDCYPWGIHAPHLHVSFRPRRWPATHGVVTVLEFLCQLTTATPGILSNQLQKTLLFHCNWPAIPRLVFRSMYRFWTSGTKVLLCRRTHWKHPSRYKYSLFWCASQIRRVGAVELTRRRRWSYQSYSWRNITTVVYAGFNSAYICDRKDVLKHWSKIRRNAKLSNGKLFEQPNNSRGCLMLENIALRGRC